MSKIKIVIEVRGGMVQAVRSNKNIEYVVVDYDNIDNGESPVGDKLDADTVWPGDTMYDYYSGFTTQETEVMEELKRMKF